jgi:large subunit ribosomal protein L15
MATSKKTEGVASRTNLTDLAPAEGSNRPKLRVGRGRASGAGKTCNRGHNGEGQRSGLSSKRGFEGGQMPMYRRLPKINGFELINQRKWLELNIEDIENILLPGEDTLTYENMVEYGILNPNQHDGIRLLGVGELTKKVAIEVHHVTPAAREKIEAAGGSIKLM